ncbi:MULTISPECIES: NAD(P)H-hydrate dehydratase [Paraliobacillus]|uniref:NAD(P)H-hydrate dehydratase n=1 Tax=Paraliobacillus TaxID=200903 RepID=UPI000DD39923|nr:MULTISPECIES: NAD(P)H-hydrate dehydratase [Paraliobacillus]
MKIVTAKEMYEVDRIAMEEKGLHGCILMENAGRSIAEKVKKHTSKSSKIIVLVGSGNNGGDGFVIARTLFNQGYLIEVIQLVTNDQIKGDALYHKNVFEQYSGIVHPYSMASHTLIAEADVIVDAMLGIGVNGKTRYPYNEIITSVNASQNLIISVDIPSGVPSENDLDFEVAIKADYTCVIEAPKLSAFVTGYASYYGEWEVISIGLPVDAFEQVQERRTWDQCDVKATLPKRDRFAHKGSHGKGLIIGGSRLMPGSVTMTAKAALRAGTGLLTIGTKKDAIPSIASQCAEATFIDLTAEGGWIGAENVIKDSNYDVIAIGMGMGREKATCEFTKQVLREAKVPVLVDADGLSHIQDDLTILQSRSYPTILTPHPGEMAMLLNCSIAEVVAAPFKVAKEFAEKYHLHLVLKGTYSIVTDPSGNQWVNTTGNQGLAKGGSGDCLSGIILAMIMQDQTISEALSNSCYIHGKSADLLVEDSHSTYDLLATDVIEGIPFVFRAFS